jgi:hypothetical protein
MTGKTSRKNPMKKNESPKVNRTVERYQLKAKSDLISALIQFRAVAKTAGRKQAAKWVERRIAEVAALPGLSEDLALQDAIVEFHNSGAAPKIFSEEMLRQFRTMLTDDELEALIDATVAAD